MTKTYEKIMGCSALKSGLTLTQLVPVIANLGHRRRVDSCHDYNN